MQGARTKIMVVASGGGHWTELLRLRPAFEGGETVYVTVQKDYAGDVQGSRFHAVNDATRWSRISLIKLALQIILILLRERPDVIVTTGAAPGYFALRMGRWFGARTIWLDSVANAEELSMSGRIAARYADLWLTQWEHLAQGDRPEFAGAVL